jgi:prevent-host-death family protein
MDVGVTELRAHLSEYLDQARSGTDVIVTERGIPVARLVAIDSAPLIERLEREGVLTPPKSKGPRKSARDHKRIRAKGSVSELVSELRR